MIWILRVAVLMAATACVTTLEGEARRAADTGLDPAPTVTALADAFTAVDTTRRIFDVQLIEARRRFGGAGVVLFQRDPRRLRVEVFGPHDTHVLSVRVEHDWMTVTLPQDGEILEGAVGDPRFAALTGERALVGREVFGALVGAYDIEALIDDAIDVHVRLSDDEERLYVRTGEAMHAFTLELPERRLTRYRQSKGGRLAFRVAFSDYRRIGGRWSPWRVVLREYHRERQLLVVVRQEDDDLAGGFDREGAVDER